VPLITWGPGGSRFLRLEAWKAATHAAFFAMAGWAGVRDRKADVGRAAVVVLRAAADRAVCLSSSGRIAEAIAGYFGLFVERRKRENENEKGTERPVGLNGVQSIKSKAKHARLPRPAGSEVVRSTEAQTMRCLRMVEV
jgi:hypothetical protein